MLRNYFLFTWRNIKRNKLFSFINVFGIAIGLTCCFLIILFTYHETSFGSYHKNEGNQYSFLEDDIRLLYEKEKRWHQIINYPTVLSILICCIGLFGLAYLAATPRTNLLNRMP